jgi:hypothetical protein
MSAVDNAVIAGRDVRYVPGHFEPAQARRESAADSITSAIVRCAYSETLKPSPANWTSKVLTGTAVPVAFWMVHPTLSKHKRG